VQIGTHRKFLLKFTFITFARAAVRVLFGICIIVTDSAANAESFSSRLNRAAYFAASTKNAAFPVRSSDGRLALLLVDFESGKFKKLVIKGSSILSPYLSVDGARMLFVRHPDNQQGSELVSCDIDRLSCNSVLRSEGSIGFPIEIGGGLFVNDDSSPLKGLSIPVSYTSLYGFSGPYKSVELFQGAINYTFPKTKYVTVGLSYMSDRNLETFEAQKVYKASLGLKY
jgi:hypothetical protein